jgi:hypothetical protein
MIQLLICIPTTGCTHMPRLLYSSIYRTSLYLCPLSDSLPHLLY